jgi:hypothetical protein
MWSEVGERTFIGPATIVEAEENVAKVRENLKIAQSRQKSYAALHPRRVHARARVPVLATALASVHPSTRVPQP